MKTFEFTQEQIDLLLDCIETTIEENRRLTNDPILDKATKEMLADNTIRLKTLKNYLDA